MDEYPHIVHLLLLHPEIRRSLLSRIAEQAKKELHDVPSFKKTPTWQSWLSSFKSVGRDTNELPVPAWKLDVTGGPDCIDGLQHFLEKSTHKKAPRWRAAARQLRLCIDGLKDPENMQPVAINNLIAAMSEYDRFAGRSTRHAQSERARKKRGSDEVARIIKKLAARDEPAKALWDKFIGDLDVAGMRPVETVNPADHRKTFVRFESDGKPHRSISAARFENRISEAKEK